MPVNLDVISTTNIELVKLNTKISDLYKPGAKEFICDISNTSKVSVYLDPYNTPDIIYIFGVPKITNESFTNHVLLYKNITGKSINVPLEVKNYKYLYISINKNSAVNNITDNPFVFIIENIGTTKVPVAPTTTTPKPTTTTSKPATTTPKPTTTTTTKAPQVPFLIDKMTEIKINTKISESFKPGAKEFFCNVVGLEVVALNLLPLNTPDIIYVFGIPELTPNIVPVLLYKNISSDNIVNKLFEVQKYKYLYIAVNKDTNISNNPFVFSIDTLKPTTTKAPTTTTAKPTTTTKAPTTTTTLKPTTKVPTTTPAPVIKEIPLNKKVSDLDRLGSNVFSCKVNGLTDVKVVMDPFGVPNQFSIFGIDTNNATVRLFEARWGMSRRIAPLKVSTFKSIQIKVDKDFYIPSNSFEFTVIGDEKLLK